MSHRRWRSTTEMQTDLLKVIRSYYDVTWDEWVSAGWWDRDAVGYRTVLGLSTYQILWLDGYI